MRWHLPTRRLLAGLTLVVLLGGCTQGVAPFPSMTRAPESLPTVPATSVTTATSAPAPSSSLTSGIFSPTGSMITARLDGFTATLLPDGRVLIAGGEDANQAVIASAELYDPKTGKFRPAGSMTTARAYHTATLLPDGSVLISGGYNDLQNLASAELYDPKTGTFSPTGSMGTVRIYHTATLLSDGRVLIAGGAPNCCVSQGPDLASAELYDPATGTFSPTGSMTTGRAGHTATLLSDGRVLVAGAEDSGNHADLYDPRTGRFTPTGSMPADQYGLTATLLSDGRVLLAGGHGSDSPLASA
ncbi:MAG: kelch repeat-containing protein, partial [Candidatus Limnocylindrales bacterium]